MSVVNSYFEGNRESWNSRSSVHYESKFYDVETFVKGRSSLNEIELREIGDVNGKSVLHLQCHFGQDTLSLARMGAKVTGIDMSDKGIELANKLKELTGLEANFVVSNIYELKDVLSKKFDMVYTSYGVLGWLPDLEAWAGIVSHFLKPGGVFYMAEFHPIIWMYDDKFENIVYPYQKSEVIIDELDSTYADKNVNIKLKDYNWNHGLGDVLSALVSSGLEVEFLREHDYSPYDIFEDSVEVNPGRFMVKGLEGKFPLVYSIKALKK